MRSTDHGTPTATSPSADGTLAGGAAAAVVEVAFVGVVALPYKTTLTGALTR